MQPQPIAFFLGGYTPQGFFSLFDQLTNEPDGHCLILQGGPGCGKSTLLWKIAAQMAPKSPAMQYIHCSSDPESLDALILPELELSIVDGTAPHQLLPRRVGASEQLFDLGQCLDTRLLYPKRREIAALQSDAQKHTAQAVLFLQQAAALSELNTQLLTPHADLEKAQRLTDRLCRQVIGTAAQARGHEEKRLLSAFTQEGFHHLWETLPALAEHIYLLEDPYSIYVPAMLAELRRYALAHGHSVISCCNPLHPHRLEHLILPRRALAFVSVSHLYTPTAAPEKVINARRFLTPAVLRQYKKELARNRHTIKTQLRIAAEEMALARTAHMELEALYSCAMDYAAADERTEKLLLELEGADEI